ncbi:glutathione S-transferase N-terminal domain-containing protein [Salinisphaera orenii]|uniref:Stringent starvation protein A n=1 Tax=Salinisphaera orenii YIM 95161 TaxID=1051139 RepID=A0A423QAQ5_9GAMM|nr:glutathione S-transferase N-terminal domain-containing protein [Salinisphaera halophila]ROO37671.1 stringent starvation protein A [Salinisphaera halophila YIM 95161]
MASRSSTITLYSRADCVHSHRVRLIMAEKGVAGYEVVALRDDEESEDLLQLNPYNTVPTLVDRELVVYDPRIIIEYVDERYPHPPLMPVDPVLRAQYRLAIYRMEMDLYPLCDELESTPAVARKARGRMTELLTTLAAEFSPRTYIGEEFSLVDCTLAPVLWRLNHYGVELPKHQHERLHSYARRLFARPAFERSLSPIEAQMGTAGAP